MKHVSFESAACPVARALERVGEWWTMLILREALNGVTRFDEFQRRVEGIAPNTLTRRLKDLVAAGLLERCLYSERPPRYEYRLTSSGQDFLPVLWAMLAWGNKHFCPEGELVGIADRRTGARVEPCLVDRATGRELTLEAFEVVPGPAAAPDVVDGFRSRAADASPAPRPVGPR